MVITAQGLTKSCFSSVSPIHRELSLGRLRPSGLPLRTSIPSLSTSKETSPSPSSCSTRSSLIPISKSQDDLLRNVTLRRENKDSVTGKLRPSSYRGSGSANPSPSGRNSKLMSRNSVEVLTYTESQKNNSLHEIGARKYHSQNRVNNKHEAASKFTKKFGSRDSSLNIYSRSSRLQKTVVGTQRNASLIPQPATAPSKKSSGAPPPPAGGKKQTPPSYTASPGQNKKTGSSSNKSSNKEKYGGSQASRLSTESLKSDDRIRANNAKNNANTSRLCSAESKASPMITERKPDKSSSSSSVGTGKRKLPVRSQSETAEKVLSEQLLRGKLPPKAKFRADDEISIGDPADPPGEEAGELRAPCNDPSPSTTPSCPSMPAPSPPSHASLVVARCLSEGGRGRDEKTNSLPLNSVLCLEQSEPGREAARSTSLSNYYKGGQTTQAAGKNTSEGFFQRLSNLRRSFNVQENKRLPNKIRPHLTASNSPFFQGIADVKKSPGPHSSSSSKVQHSANLVILPVIKSYKPPVRKYQFQRAFPIRKEPGVKRSFSFSDAQIIAQSVIDGEGKVLSDLYPSFLVSGTLYTLGDKAKLSKNDDNSRVSNSSVNCNKPPLGKDRNSSELTNTARQNKGEDDSQEDRISLPTDGSQVTLTSSVVSTRDAAGKN